jgi:threonine dehydrogenase-like Zn-dependent dehydrogenase
VRTLGSITTRAYTGPVAPIRLAEVPEPRLPGPEWVVVKTKMSGICASDMSAITMKESPTLTPFASFPFIPGHENVGTIFEAGRGVRPWKLGDRVVVNPALSCAARGLTSLCPPCARGETSVCEMAAEGKVAKGLSTGYSHDTGGGWSPYFLAHRSQLYSLDGIADEEGVMIDAFSSALHPVMNHLPKKEQAALVIGAGPIGLSAIQAIGALSPGVTIIVMDKSAASLRRAREAGAHYALGARTGASIYEEVAEITGARVYKPLIGQQILMGGVDTVFDTVGHGATIQMSLRLLRTGGTYALIGLAATERLDLTPLWFKEITMAGSLGYGAQAYEGKQTHTWDVALDLISKKRVRLAPYVTHVFALDEWRTAIRTNLNKEKCGAVKTAFVFD